MDDFKLISINDYYDGWRDSCNDITNEWNRLTELVSKNESFTLEDITLMFDIFLSNYAERRK